MFIETAEKSHKAPVIQKFMFLFTKRVGKRETIVIEATDHIAAKKDFERKEPTGRILNTTILA